MNYYDKVEEIIDDFCKTKKTNSVFIVFNPEHDSLAVGWLIKIIILIPYLYIIYLIPRFF